MSRFDTFIAIDWSGASGSYEGIAIARCAFGEAAPEIVPPRGRRWSRGDIADWLAGELKSSARILIGLDFAFALPFGDHGYLGADCAHAGDGFALWDMIEEASGGAADFGVGSLLVDPRFEKHYWCSGKMPSGWSTRHRLTERTCGAATGARPETVFKLIGSKQIGKAALTGMRVLRAVRTRNTGRVTIWPFEPAGNESVIVEIFPTIFRKQAGHGLKKIRDVRSLNDALSRLRSTPFESHSAEISDHDSDALLSAAGLRNFQAMNQSALPELSNEQIRREGWIFGVPLPTEPLMPSAPPTLTLPHKGGGDSFVLSPSPLTGEGWGGGGARADGRRPAA